jgi:hypothetical protein
VLTTGLHTVCDIFCVQCEENIGQTSAVPAARLGRDSVAARVCRTSV